MDYLDRANLSVAFVLAYESSPYAGVVRPFINWAKELKRMGFEVEILLYKTGISVAERLDKLGIRYSAIDSFEKLRRSLQRESYTYVIIDDYIKRLNLVAETVPHKKLFVYAQVLFGIHAVLPSTDHSTLPIRHRIIFDLTKAVPFAVLRRIYAKKLFGARVIANSNTTEMLLYTLYGIMSRGIVYPPVDTEVFKWSGTSKRSQVILYLGSNAGDTNTKLVEKVCRILNKKRFDVILFGNKRLMAKLRGKCRADYVTGISDEELAKLYSESAVTIAPQIWEMFGYVVAESILCGTPVIAFNIMGPKEIVNISRFGFLANNVEEFIEIIDNIENYIAIDQRTYDVSKLPFTIRNSTQELLRMLDEKTYENRIKEVINDV